MTALRIRFHPAAVLGSVSPLHNKKDDNRYKGFRQAGLLSTIPVLLVVSPMVGFFMGRFLDGKFNTDPILTVIGLILGFIAGGRQIARVIKLANRDEDQGKD